MNGISNRCITCFSKIQSSFLGIVRRISNISDTVSIVSVPVNLGQPYLGPDLAPSLILNSGLTKQLGDCGWRVKQLPTVTNVNITSVKSNQSINAKNVNEVGTVCERVKVQIEKELSETNNFILSLGGDHCIAMGTIPGILSKRKNTGIIWVDAHADIHTPESSFSGNMHGMPLGFLLGLTKNMEDYPALHWLKPCLVPKDIVYIGLRDIDGPEKRIIKQLRIKSFSMFEIDRYGIAKVMEMTLDHLSSKENLHLSYDIDALDPFFAPSTGTAVRGGLTFREGNYICEILAESKKLSSMDLVEVNPTLHSDMEAHRTVEMAMTIIGSAMGQTIL